MKTTMYMAVDQYGDTYHDLGQYPRRELLNRLGRRHAEKMYTDNESHEGNHIGYIIGGRWCQLYIVSPFEGKPTTSRPS